MNPKMTVQEAASCLGLRSRRILKFLQKHALPFCKSQGYVYFRYATSKRLFDFSYEPQVVSFQIVKGGTGKTSVAFETAVRANLYGAKVLCIDLDQQGNLTNALGVNAEVRPIMIDILADEYSYQEAICEVYEGLDLIGSRIENSLLDEVIREKEIPLDEVFKLPLEKLKKNYDLIVIDCPPHLGQAVASVTLAANLVVSPVTPDGFAMKGLEMTYRALGELEASYGYGIPLGVLLNKYDKKTKISKEGMQALLEDSVYQRCLMDSYIRLSNDFPTAISKQKSVFDNPKSSIAKEDIDHFVRDLLGIDKMVPARRAELKALSVAPEMVF